MCTLSNTLPLTLSLTISLPLTLLCTLLLCTLLRCTFLQYYGKAAGPRWAGSKVEPSGDAVGGADGNPGGGKAGSTSEGKSILKAATMEGAYQPTLHSNRWISITVRGKATLYLYYRCYNRCTIYEQYMNSICTSYVHICTSHANNVTSHVHYVHHM